MTELIYLTDSYQKELKTKVVSVARKGNVWEIILEKTIFYPQGGGQLSDIGEIAGPMGKAHVKHVRMHEGVAVHECGIEGTISSGETVTCQLDWERRYLNMRRHSGGHIVHEAVMHIAPNLKPLKADHGTHMFIEYNGTLPIDKKYEIEKQTNEIVEKNVPLTTEMVSYEEVLKRAAHIAGTLPKNKPLRLLQVGDFPPMPDGGTQVAKSNEVGPIIITNIENSGETVRIYYAIEEAKRAETVQEQHFSPQNLISELLQLEQDAERRLEDMQKPHWQLREDLLGPKSELATLIKKIRLVPSIEKHQVGIVINQVKKAIEEKLQAREEKSVERKEDWIDITIPGKRPPEGHLHIVSQAITEITKIFERIGFTRVRHPEVDWDWYAFESLNMPKDHPARDEWETFFIKIPEVSSQHTPGVNKVVLTPHTSNGQVREMERGKLPIRMINIAKCYRRQSDVSHVPMFHQFEGLYVDRNVSISHLKGVLDYFVKQFFGLQRKARIRPFHFQFTEPSFEVDISCGVCLGKGCRLCKAGWLELGGAGMVHPNVLSAGKIPKEYNGFAFGWGIERTYMMKAGTQLDDIRLLYSNTIRFLEQF